MVSAFGDWYMQVTKAEYAGGIYGYNYSEWGNKKSAARDYL